MKKIIALIIFNLFIVTPSITLATPGNLNSSGGHRCYFNCGNYPRFTMHYHLKGYDDFDVVFDEDYGTKSEVWKSILYNNVSPYEKTTVLTKKVFYEDDPTIEISGKVVLKNKKVAINDIKIMFFIERRLDSDLFPKTFSPILDKNGNFSFSFDLIDKDLNERDYVVSYSIYDGNKYYYSKNKNTALRLNIDYRKIFFSGIKQKWNNSFGFTPDLDCEKENKSRCIYLYVSYNGKETDFSTYKTNTIYNFEINKGELIGLKKATLTLDDGRKFNLLKSSEVTMDLFYTTGRIERVFTVYLEDDNNKISKDFKIRLRDYIQ